MVGSAIEVALLAAIVHYAWAWPKEGPRTSATGRAAPAPDAEADVRQVPFLAAVVAADRRRRGLHADAGRPKRGLYPAARLDSAATVP